MTHHDTSVVQLVEHLANEWRPDQFGLAHEFVKIWKDKLNVGAWVKNGGRNALRFVTDLGEIRLRGMNEVPCLLVGGDGENEVGDFWRKTAGPGRLPFILALSDRAYGQAKTYITDSRGLLLSSSDLKQLLTAVHPRTFLTNQLHKQIPKQRLIPYDYLRSVEGGMFFGRRTELNRLRYEDNLSFAIVGPGKVGKSSLVKQYQRQMIIERDPRHTYRFYIDFYECNDLTPDGVARFFAMKIDPSKQSSRLTADGLIDFLKYQSYRMFNGPLDLLLDEVDEVCNGEAFRFLGEAAKQGYCRLALCGKGSLLRLMQDENSPLRGRLELIRLEPLDTYSARKLILEPLNDLGLKISDPDLLVERIFRLTGRLPHLLQISCKKLATLAIEGNLDEITRDDIETLKWDFGAAQVFTEPLRNLTDPAARLLGLLLIKDGREEFPIPVVQKLAETENLSASLRQITDLCNELVISNVLAWRNGKYCIATGALYDYARNLGLLEDDSLNGVRLAALTQTVPPAVAGG